ncbi:MAG: hypothetical protein L0241_06660, partial [Planctomycetia bacterium]|nr:hypothetical protein [Planctomycetia bacterium]
MTRVILFTVPLLLFAGSAGADDVKGEKTAYTVYDAYFEKNNSGLKGDSSFLAFADKAGFEKVFALRPPVGAKKPTALAADAFDKQFVAAVIRRGNSITTYTVQMVTLDKDTLYVKYKSAAGPAGTAKFASPLIVSASKDKVKKVVFIENDKTV